MDLKTEVRRFLTATHWQILGSQTLQEAGLPIPETQDSVAEFDRAACITLHPGPVRGNGTIDIIFQNEGKAAARDISVIFDTGHDFPERPDRPNWRQMDPARQTDNPRRFSASFTVDPPRRDDAGNYVPNQRRDVGCRVTYRDDRDAWTESLFLFNLTNSSSDRFIWTVKEDQTAAVVSPPCKHTRPNAVRRGEGEAMLATQVVDPRDEDILVECVKRLIDDPDAQLYSRDLVARPPLNQRGSKAIGNGIDRLCRREQLRVEQRYDDDTVKIRLERVGVDRALGLIYSNCNTLIERVARAICARCPDSDSETSIAEIADVLGMPIFVVEQFTWRLHEQKHLRVRQYADVAKIDHPSSELCR